MALDRQGKDGVRPYGAGGGSWANGKGRFKAHTHSKNGHSKANIEARQKPRFATSRVQELLDNDSIEASGSLSPESNHSMSDSRDISEEEESRDSIANTDKSYNMLLHSLKSNTQKGGPAPKKRKISNEDSQHKEAISGIDIDTVEEPEETATLELEGVDDSEDEKPNDTSPFNEHFNDRAEIELAKAIRAVENGKWVSEKSIMGPSWSSTSRRPDCDSLLQNPKKSIYRAHRELPLKAKLKVVANENSSPLDDLGVFLSSTIFHYRDVSFSGRTLNNADTIRELVGFHVLNHVFTTRDKVIKNNLKASKNVDDDELDLRDQGFTRPKVLILLPTRQSCVKMIEKLISICRPEQQENRKRFLESYAERDDILSETKPPDFKDLFGGNDDDLFRLGLKFTRKTLKYFAQFYSSDIIFASPLGLRMALGSEKTEKQDHDFLSSIEIVVVDQADALSMQNWDHVDFIFDKLNLQPREAHGCDFSRVKSWYLDGHARYLRQTILLSAFNFPSLNRLFLHHTRNIGGSHKVSNVHDGAMFNLDLPCRQTFSRYNSNSPISDPEDRFNFFISAVLPPLTKAPVQHGTLIFLPLYADFVRIRNHLTLSSSTQHISFGSISEYSSMRDVARSRSHFYSGRHSLLLYTERAHHFRRYHLKGVERIIMYGLPENPLFYKELAGYLTSSIAEGKVDVGRTSIRSLFSKFDLLKAERTVGTKRYLSLFSDQGDTFDFV